MNIKRVPHLGQIINTIIITLLLITTFTTIYFKNKCEKLSEINNELNITIDNLESERDDLANQIYEMTNKNPTSTTVKDLGRFKITAYCSCKKCCGKWSGGPTASGVMPQAGRTIAVDPRVIPLGSKVIIDGHTYIAEDTGSAIKGNKIDLYCSSHKEAISFGVQYKNVSVIK